MAANLASIAVPNASPARPIPTVEDRRLLAIPQIASRPADHKARSGVSVDIRKLPSPVAGKLIQIKAANRPACCPKSHDAPRHNNRAVIKCIQQAGNLTAQV